MNHSISFDQLTFGEKIGEFNHVVRGKWNGKQVVTKKYLAATEKVEREYRELKNANHENIIFLYGISYHNEFVYFVMEYMDGGSLHDLIHCQKQIKYDQAHVINWALQCARY
ncbi:GH18924 [Drosophila grimshawi]|uniref:GH18924 n=1 Tax=Drosophila grimshawi TaxID=7222 RepID=B4JH49_DROGR|nr:GH18924 [Drosophila grimshawi]